MVIPVAVFGLECSFSNLFAVLLVFQMLLDVASKSSAQIGKYFFAYYSELDVQYLGVNIFYNTILLLVYPNL